MQKDSERHSTQARRLALMVELCSDARDIALRSIDRGEELDMLSVFAQALANCLQRGNYDKNDLTNIWAMLELGSRAIMKYSLDDGLYERGTLSDPLSSSWRPDEQSY